jgi:hypothetical protein
MCKSEPQMALAMTAMRTWVADNATIGRSM